jgi:ATP-dependent DNA helicase RecG
MPLALALKKIHFPKTEEDIAQARRRLVFDEFFFFQLSLANRYMTRKITENADPLHTTGELITRYRNTLPYTLTNAQERAIQDIANDVTKPIAMNRLIQGDVGAGKTDVAVMSLLFAINSRKKAIIMAPTEILAVQHYLKFKSYLDPLNIPIYILKGGMKKKEKQETLDKLSEETPCIIVGTHALIETNVTIPNLGLAIIDEQHRFGVIQRLKLKKSQSPHCLFMTATPIPRTLLITSFGDLDKSIIDQMPPGRTPPKTYFFKEKSLPTLYTYFDDEIKKGFQVYVVFPLVEESEKIDLKSAIEGWEQLKSHFPNYEIGLVHGRMTPQEKSDIMKKFKEKTYQILVATTVIEVGIDVPNATIMMIHHAERFGLSQLHQLRGRIGRGAAESRCFLIGEPKTQNAKQRIKAMLDTTDGFKIAEYDLEIRGPGDMLGTRQSGLPEFNLGHLIRDEAILQQARKTAFAILESDPELTSPEHQHIKKIQTQKKQATTFAIEETMLN